MTNKKKILIIEDDIFAIEVYKRILTKEGFEVEIADTGQEAEEKIKEINQGKKEKPDFILLDLLLPGITSRQSLLKEIKQNSFLKDVPIFVLTNYPDPNLAKGLLRKGVDKFLLKTSYSPSDLVKMIKKRLIDLS